MTTTARTRYEIRVRTRLSPVALARLRVALTPIAVPSRTVRRLRVAADHDITDVVRALTERNIEVLEVRRSPVLPARRGAADRTVVDAVEDEAPRSTGDDVITALRSRIGAGLGRSPAPSSSRGTARVLPFVPRTP
jgi:hypothetical protein